MAAAGGGVDLTLISSDKRATGLFIKGTGGNRAKTGNWYNLLLFIPLNVFLRVSLTIGTL